MILHLLTLRRKCAEQGTARKDQVFSLFISFFIHKEVFLLRTNRGVHGPHVCLSELVQDLYRLLGKHIHGTEQRCLLVQSLSAVGTESRRNVKCFILDKCRGGRVPGRVATRLKGRAKSARGKARCVRFSFSKLPAGKIHDHLAVSHGGEEAVMLLRRVSGHGLEPVRVMCGAVFNRPLLHGHRHGVCHIQLQMCVILDCLS